MEEVLPPTIAKTAQELLTEFMQEKNIVLSIAKAQVVHSEDGSVTVRPVGFTVSFAKTE